jgi:hypothetical protein
MKEEKQRIAIAEICGWIEIRDGDAWGTPIGIPKDIQRRDCWIGAEGFYELPNYPNDLNAMHEAVSVFDYDQADEFDDHLCEICKRANDLADNPTPWRFAVTNATAEQRSEAFLRVFGKWEETE